MLEGRALRAALVCAMAGALTVSGCAPPSGGGSSKGAASTTAPVPVVKVDEIAANLPGEYRDAGKLVIGANIPYPPMEFTDADGEMAGFDVDLMDAVATTLGLTTEYHETEFSSIIPSVASGDLDLGMSAVTDTKEREKLVDLVTYFTAGSQWAQRPGSDIDPKNACGKAIAVQANTMQATEELPAKSKACVDAGKRELQVVEFIDPDAVDNAVIVGKVDAMTADSPVTAYAIKENDGKLEAAGAMFDAAPFGWPVKKDSLLGPALQKALENLIKTGAYKQIAAKWGLVSGMLDKPVINGAPR